MRANRIFMALLAAAAMGTGCAPGSDEDDPNAAAADQSTDEARAAWTRLVGAWTGTGTGSAYSALVFTTTGESGGHHFFGEHQVTCVRAPCDPERVEGSFGAGTRYLTLTVDGTATRYTYALSGDTLTLSRSGRTVASLHRVESYCRDDADAREVCAEQSLRAPRCAPGHWTCTTESTCSYACGSGGGVGATCGGIAGLTCNEGLRCVLDSTMPDATGHCHLVSQDGGPCGGFVLYPPVCADGLRCVPPAPGGPSDQPGTCRASSSHGVGTMCGGIAGITCDDGLTCVLDGSYPDASGTCRTAFCPTARCASGTTCCESARACQPAGLLCRL